MNIIGISAFFHDSACCIMQDGILKAAVEEERFSRIKADPSLPRLAFRYCLENAGISISDVDCIAYYEDPCSKLARQLWSGALGNTPALLQNIQPSFVINEIGEKLGYDGPVKFMDHHRSHAASAFYFSGFKQAALFTVDGVGEWSTTTYGTGDDQGVSIFESVEFPDSLGLLYSTITSYLGFGVNDGEYKVMGLAPYGKPLYADKIRRLIQSGPGGQYALDMEYFDFLHGKEMYNEKLEALLGRPAREEDAAMTSFHEDIARSLQLVLEEILIEKAGYLYEKTGASHLCMAGGVALNCVANGQIFRHTPFSKLFVQPASNDAGCAVGAAALACHELSGVRPSAEPLRHVYIGPGYTKNQVRRLMESTSLQFHDYSNRPEELLAATAQRLKDGKVIGWFQGRMEFGPRALGARSILADPRIDTMRDRINSMVKMREGFRPFAPAAMYDKVKDHFDIDHESPFMLETCQVISPLSLPAITHVDGSARLQTVHPATNPRFYRLLEIFDELTGCPILLNTSFNVKGEPVVCTPEDALKCFILTDIDSLVIEDFIVDRRGNNLEMLKIFLGFNAVKSSGIAHNVYTFV